MNDTALSATVHGSGDEGGGSGGGGGGGGDALPSVRDSGTDQHMRRLAAGGDDDRRRLRLHVADAEHALPLLLADDSRLHGCPSSAAFAGFTTDFPVSTLSRDRPTHAGALLLSATHSATDRPKASQRSEHSQQPVRLRPWAGGDAYSQNTNWLFVGLHV